MRSWIVPVIVLASLAAAAPASAFNSGNLIVNGGPEAGPGATDSGTTQEPPSWQVAGATAVAYGTSGFLTTSQAASWAGGNNFFAGGTGSFGDASILVQQIDLTPQGSQ